jgi:hypothetical protein
LFCLTTPLLGLLALLAALDNVILVNRLLPAPVHCWSGGWREHSWTWNVDV